MTEFQRRWGKNNLLEQPKNHLTELTEAPVRENFSPIPPESHPTELTEAPGNAVGDALLSRLQAGGRWLTAQHQAWIEGKENAASEERFSVALAAWGELERSLRLVFGYEGCVFGPDRRCPADAPVVCDYCAETKDMRHS